MTDLTNFIFALCLGGIIGWFLHGTFAEYDKKVRAKIRSKI